MKTKKIDLKNLTRSQLTDFVLAQGLSSFRARQIFSWLYRPGITNFSQMTDLSKKFRQSLDEQVYFSSLTPAVREQSVDGTIKYGFLLDDGAMIESVLIPEKNRNTLCISTQVGCAMGCRFCLTATMGFVRNLTPAEIVNQVCAVLADVTTHEMGTINNLVYMGMGEPLANFDNLLTSLRIVMDELGLNFSERRTTVSTCGLVPKIKELGEKIRVNLAISLHAADDETRSQLMPVNRTWNLDSLLLVCRQYSLPKRRRIMIEYILLRDINDSESDARLLAQKLRSIRCKINLIPCNEAPDHPFHKPSQKKIDRFQQILHEAGYTVIVRSSRGSDISAACGQLAVHAKGN
ncbi:MAG: 23S rRNA (adenine(2503)-C(2))-methyltransferase RlmN [Thermodesulfobacteriota bacterium]|nr:23S rRNA (adenine(2503)-C(2))-methyltransferase RlmN [Thermodesulfobacteriota bacterium]